MAPLVVRAPVGAAVAGRKAAARRNVKVAAKGKAAAKPAQKQTFMEWLNDAFVKDSRDWAGYEDTLKSGNFAPSKEAKPAAKAAKKGGLFGR